MTAAPLLKYLGQTCLSSNKYWPAVEQNLRQAREKWGRLVKILVREGSDKRTSGKFYVAVLQAVNLFGSDIWVITPWMEKSLKSSHHWVVRKIAIMGPKCQRYGT